MPRILTPKTVGITIAVLVSAALYLRNAQDFNSASHHVPGDFKVYLRAAERASVGIDPYIASEGSPYKYSLGAVSPFLLLPHDDAAAWKVFKFLCLGMWLMAILLGTSFSTWGEVGALCIGIALSWKGIIEALDYGQIEFILLFASVLAARKKSAPGFAGFIIGLLPPFKLPWAAMLAPFLIVFAKDSKSAFFKCLGGFCFGVLLLGGLIPTYLFGLQNTITWSQSWTRLLATQPSDIYFGDMNQGLFSTFSRWYQFQPVVGLIASLLISILFVYAVISLLRQLLQNEKTEPLAFVAPYLIALQLINPLSWRWGSTLLVGSPFAILKRGSLKTFTKLILVSLAIGSFLVQQNPIAHLLGFGHWTELNHFGSITIFWMILLLLCV